MKFATSSLVMSSIGATMMAAMNFFNPEGVYRALCIQLDFKTCHFAPPAEEAIRRTAAVWLSFAILAARGIWDPPSRRQDALFFNQMFYFFNFLVICGYEFRFRPNNINWFILVFAAAALFFAIMCHRENSKVIAQGDTKQKKIEGGEQKKIE